jgi:hypothetical protein
MSPLAQLRRDVGGKQPQQAQQHDANLFFGLSSRSQG